MGQGCHSGAGFLAVDLDSDGVLQGEDCDDEDPTVHPGAKDLCGDGVDGDCDGRAPAPCGPGGWWSADDAVAREVGVGEGDWAGWALATGDFTADGEGDLAVSAPFASVNGTGTGSVYILEGPFQGEGWLGKPRALLRGSVQPCCYGYRIANAGDTDGDGSDDLWVGSPADSSLASLGGSAWLFRGPLLEERTPAEADVRVLGEDPESLLGLAVEAGTDLNGDGESDLLLGAPGASVGRGSPGAALLFLGPFLEDRTSQQADVRYSGLSQGGQMGWTVLLGETGSEEVWIAAPYANRSRGAIYRFVGTGNPHREVGTAQAVLRGGPEGEEDLATWGGDLAGTSLAGGDLTGDGEADLVVGAPGYDGGGEGGGGAFLLKGPVEGKISLSDKGLLLMGVSSGGRAGSSLQVGDTTLDGQADLWVGAPGEGPAWAPGVGAAFLLEGPVDESIPLDWSDARIIGPPGETGFGTALVVTLEPTEVGLWVGTPFLSSDADEVGAVYGFIRGPGM